MTLAFDFLRVLATCSSVVLSISPYPDFQRVHRRQQVGELSLLPVVMLFCNAYLWCVYGVVADSLFPLVLVNFIGVLTSISFSAVYYRWGTDCQRRYARKLWLTAVAAMLIATSYATAGVHGATNQLSVDVASCLGLVCVVANILLFASPLETVGRVIHSRSAASLPISLCVANLVSGGLWSAMAIGQHDVFVLLPNALGTVLSAVQVGLYVEYPPPKETQQSRSVSFVTSAEKLHELSIKTEVQPVPTVLSPLVVTSVLTSPFGERYGSQGVVAV